MCTIAPASASSRCENARIDLLIFSDHTFEGDSAMLERILRGRREQAAEAERLNEAVERLTIADVRAT